MLSLLYGCVRKNKQPIVEETDVSPIHQLPNEILLCILQYVNEPQTTEYICKRWNSLTITYFYTPLAKTLNEKIENENITVASSALKVKTLFRLQRYKIVRIFGIKYTHNKNEKNCVYYFAQKVLETIENKQPFLSIIRFNDIENWLRDYNLILLCSRILQPDQTSRDNPKNKALQSWRLLKHAPQSILEIVEKDPLEIPRIADDLRTIIEQKKENCRGSSLNLCCLPLTEIPEEIFQLKFKKVKICIKLLLPVTRKNLREMKKRTNFPNIYPMPLQILEQKGCEIQIFLCHESKNFNNWHPQKALVPYLEQNQRNILENK